MDLSVFTQSSLGFLHSIGFMRSDTRNEDKATYSPSRLSMYIKDDEFMERTSTDRYIVSNGKCCSQLCLVHNAQICSFHWCCQCAYDWNIYFNYLSAHLLWWGLGLKEFVFKLACNAYKWEWFNLVINVDGDIRWSMDSTTTHCNCVLQNRTDKFIPHGVFASVLYLYAGENLLQWTVKCMLLN